MVCEMLDQGLVFPTYIEQDPMPSHASQSLSSPADPIWLRFERGREIGREEENGLSTRSTVLKIFIGAAGGGVLPQRYSSQRTFCGR